LNGVLQRSNAFFSRGFMAHFSDYENAYYNSQYVKKANASPIPDETFESYAGAAFLKGKNPILIVHEHPPLGRYIIGMSILLFDNSSTIILPLLMLSFVGVFLIGRLILQDTFLALFPLGIFVNEPLTMGKLNFAPLLEPIQLPFIIFALYFFIKGVKSKDYLHWFLFTSIMLGFVISIRFFILGFAEGLAMVAYCILSRSMDRKLLTFILTLPLSLVVLLLSYTRTIQDGYSFWQIFGVQKYIFYYHQSQLITPL
jgi:hypothetical protein